MKNVETRVNGIIIPTGPTTAEDFVRVGTAIKYNRDFCDSCAPYIVSGIGTDLNEFLGERENGVDSRFLNHLDVHSPLWDFMVARTEKTGEVFGVDSVAVNTEGNMRNCFPWDQNGHYAIVSFPGHLERMKSYEMGLRANGELSDDLTIEYVPTKRFSDQTLLEHVHGLKGFSDRVLFYFGRSIC
ncbi:hypothetical protein HOD88_02315 [archaeon]|jgi:hypothetical protein|nr:hypothetical protein [archaeon]